MVEEVHTLVKGRARYKIKGLYHSEPFKRYLELRLSHLEEIIQVSASTLTGNILVIFNPHRSPSEIATLIKEIAWEYLKQSLEPIPPTGVETQKVEPWHLMETESVLASLNTSSLSGLSNESVRENLRRYGPNSLSLLAPRSGLSIFVDQFKSLPVALLAVTAGISVFTAGIADAFIILGTIALNAVLGYITESRSEKIVHSLRNITSSSALVIRDGETKEIGIAEVVPGDILVLKPGSYIVADGRLLEADFLSIDESMLTGESMPVTKTSKSLTGKKEIPLGDRVNMVYRGTLVMGGQGIAVVVATGRFTEMGQIQTLVEAAEFPGTSMEIQLNRVSRQLVLIGGVVCSLTLIISFLRGYNLVQMLMTSLSLAMITVPEGLPTVATTTRVLGIKRMRKHNLLIRRLGAVETLGSIQTICLDKTGTLTLNRMTVVAIHAGMKRMIVISGKFITEKDYVAPFACDELLRLMEVSVLCSETEVSKQEGKYILRGSPTENSLVDMALDAGIDVLELREKYPILKITYRSENRHYMSTLHIANEKATEPSHLLLALKGSPGEVLAMCRWFMKNGEKMPLTEEDRLDIETENARMAGEALRVLGVAYACLPAKFKKGKEEKKGNGEKGEGEDFRVPEDLIWLGLVGMIDPIRKGAKKVIETLHQAGIDTIMITGDQSPTAYAIGKELNLSRSERLEILDSTHLADIDSEVMAALSGKVHVFARVSPAQKLHIVQALQRSGKVVAMTGDGINDGPALKAADIGIAMGGTGTDVAREVANVVLEDDNLETLPLAISQGRTIYSNIKKSVHFLLSKSLSEIIVVFTTMVGGIGQPLSVMQVPQISFLTDIFPGLALALDPPELDVLNRPPRNPKEPLMSAIDLKRIAFEATTLSAGALGAYGYGMLRYGVSSQAGTLAFMSLTAGQLLHAVSCRSERQILFNAEGNGQPSLPSNKYLNGVLVGALALQILSMTVPGLRNLLGIAPLGILDSFVIGGSALLPFVVNEATKKTRNY